MEWLIFGIVYWNWMLSVHVYPQQVFRQIGVVNRFEQVRGKIKTLFLQGVVLTVAVVNAKTP